MSVILSIVRQSMSYFSIQNIITIFIEGMFHTERLPISQCNSIDIHPPQHIVEPINNTVEWGYYVALDEYDSIV